MTSEKYVPWELIREYYGVEINSGVGNFTKDIEIYESANGELAWSAIRPDHMEHLNPQGVQVSSVTENDIGQMLSQIAQFQLKKPAIPATTMVEDNVDLVARIINDIRAKKTPTMDK